MSLELEEGLKLDLDFEKIRKVCANPEAVIPAIAQNADTGAVLIVGYANRRALEETLKQRVAVFWSTSRNELWIKGRTSGDLLELVDVRVNCEQNALLYRVRPRGEGACHTKGQDGKHRSTCFYRAIDADGKLLKFVGE